ncbi:hypothetical protein AB0H48_35255, partial [Streptomyces globisporus]|uniref:hypothetical protein n=1 Tax=Streptomyces globisporus TaxID=1908 RepID=UPI0034617319
GGLPLEDLCPAVVKELLPVPQPDDIALLLARAAVTGVPWPPPTTWRLSPLVGRNQWKVRDIVSPKGW